MRGEVLGDLCRGQLREGRRIDARRLRHRSGEQLAFTVLACGRHPR
ncbi:hypothetical protein ACU686_26215 [Yinghuangia aomiensis]